ncbi:sulfatase-like hydrolase/transferase [Sphingomonas sp.]|uniref:sulfatase-like hydrolase/transferase n=1 Tax=Sphingomonas sp. TaxID=28214 RepID=UPI00307D13C5
MRTPRSRLLPPLVAFAALLGAAAPASTADKRPNVVIILADDAALMDFGAYGGEARTPNIDALAGRGALFTQYRASPLCSPSRAMLLTGMDAHLTGIATIPEVLPKEQRGKPGYKMALEPGVLTLADRLRAQGYRTIMAGKWHMGEAASEMPQAHGFDRSFALAASGADNWDDRSYMPYYKDAPWFEDGVETSLPEDFYSSRFIVDKAIKYLAETDPAKPFFAYLPFQAIHIPVQAPRQFIDRYKGRYDQGWEVLRKARHQRAQALGLIPQGAPLAALPPDFRAWNSLSAQDRALYAARMEVNAAMLEAMDFHIGRLIQHLKASGQYENTIFIVSSDNGPEPSRGDDNAMLSVFQRLTGYHIGADNMGGPGSWGFIGPEWAAAAATPGAWFKFYATEGGIRVPLIMAGPGIAPRRVTSPAMITDIAPTVLEWLKVDPQASAGKPITGRSLMPVLSGAAESAYGPDDARAVEVSGNSALYLGDYKITRSVPPVGDGRWRLYNLARDPGETTDLSASAPAIMRRMLSEYAAYTKRVGVLEMPKGYDSMVQVNRNVGARLLSNYPWLYGVLGGFLLTFVALIWLALRGVRVLMRRRTAQ